VAGNICGGVVMVTLLEYVQAVLSRSSEEKQVDLDEEARA
jgi:formate/nitrite transporter FocA (FNT family)